MPRRAVPGAGRTTAKREDRPERPEKPGLGDTWMENDRILVFVGRDWAWFPSTASDLIRFARLHKWGTKVQITPKYTFAGYNPERDKLYHADVKIIVMVGREAGSTKDGHTSKGYTYRLVWDTSRMGIFDLITWHRRTSTEPRWHEFGSIAEIRPIISRNPVFPEKRGTDDD
jgi:hypothetical protein